MIMLYCVLNGKTINITNLCTSVEVSGSLTGVCRQLSVTIANGVYTKALPNINIPNYTKIWLRDENEDGSLKEGIFSGVTVDFTKNSTDVTITAFDFAYYLKQSDVTKNFSNTTAEDGAKEILNELGVEINYLYPTKIRINKILAQVNAYEAIMDLYTQVYKQTGIMFYISASYWNKVGVYRLNTHLAPTLIKAKDDNTDGNLLSIEYKEDGNNLVNRVKVYNGDNQLVTTIDNSDYSISDYGVLQKNYVLEEDKDYNTVVKETILHGIDKNISVEVLGDYQYYTGSQVKIFVPWIADLDKQNGSYVTAYISSDTHTWDMSNKSYTTKLELTLNHTMDEKELDDATEDEDSDSSSSSSSSTNPKGKDIVKYAKKFLGTPYVYGGTTPSGFDCSGFVQYVYAHFGISLGRTTYDQVKNGSAVASQDKLKVGDLVFPSNHHVGIYVGKGQIIHAPQTGDVIKISNIWSFYAGRRVL